MTERAMTSSTDGSAEERRAQCAQTSNSVARHPFPFCYHRPHARFLRNGVHARLSVSDALLLGSVYTDEDNFS